MRQVQVWARVGNAVAGLMLIVMLIAGGLAGQRLATSLALPLVIVGSLGLIFAFGLFLIVFFLTYPFVTPYELTTGNALPLPPLAGNPGGSITNQPSDCRQPAAAAHTIPIPPEPRWDKVLRIVIVSLAVFVIPFQVWLILWASGPSPLTFYGRCLSIFWVMLVVGRWIFWWAKARV